MNKKIKIIRCACDGGQTLSNNEALNAIVKALGAGK